MGHRRLRCGRGCWCRRGRGSVPVRSPRCRQNPEKDAPRDVRTGHRQRHRDGRTGETVDRAATVQIAIYEALHNEPLLLLAGFGCGPLPGAPSLTKLGPRRLPVYARRTHPYRHRERLPNRQDRRGSAVDFPVRAVRRGWRALAPWIMLWLGLASLVGGDRLLTGVSS